MSFDSDLSRLRQLAEPHGLEVVAVRWNECQRGANVGNVRVIDRERRTLWMVRPRPLQNEKVGICRAQDIALVVGNQSSVTEKVLRCISLREYLQNFGLYAQYLGVEPTTDLFVPEVDEKVSVRFQSVFLRAQTEFGTSVAHDGTVSDHDPRNILLLCTAQGTSVGQSRTTDVKLLMHTKSHNTISQLWLPSSSPVESKSSTLPMFMGPKAMGRRMNVVMNVQVPLYQHLFSSSFTPGAAAVTTPPIECPQLEEKKWQRHPHQPITVTLTAYYTLPNGVSLPSPADVTMAIQEMQHIYSKFPVQGQLKPNPLSSVSLPQGLDPSLIPGLTRALLGHPYLPEME